MEEKIKFLTEDGEVMFYVLEQTRVNGVNYLLVSEDQEDETDCYIMKDTSDETQTEAVYEFVEDEEELHALGRIFAELLEDTEII